MADQIVSWGGIESKGTAGMGVTGSLSVTSSNLPLVVTSNLGTKVFVAKYSSVLSDYQNTPNLLVLTSSYSGVWNAYLPKVGIGLENPAYNLDVYQGGPFSGVINLESSYAQDSYYRVKSYFGTVTIDNQGIFTATSANGGGGGFYANVDKLVNLKSILYVTGSSVGIGTTAQTSRLTVKGTGTTSSTTSFLVQNANASASFTVRDDGLVQLPGGGKLNFNNASAESYITTATGGTGLGSRSLTLPGTGGPAHWTFYNDGAYGIRLYDSTGDFLTITPGSTSTTSIFTINKSAASGYGGGTFVYYQTNNSNRIYTFGNPNSERGDETGVHTKIVAGAGGTVSTQYGRGGNVYLEGGAPAFTSSLPGNILISTGVTGSKVGIGTSTPSASLHISGSSGSVLFEIDSPAVNNILYVSGSGNVGINMTSSTYALHVAGPTFNTFATNTPFLVDTSANNYRIANIINNPGYHTGGYANNTFDIFSVGANTTSSAAANQNPFFRVNLAGGNSTGYYGSAGTNNSLAQLNSITTSTLVASAQGGGIAVIGGTSTATVTTISQGVNLNLRSDINGTYAGGGINYYSSINGSQHSHVWYHNVTEQMRLAYTGELLIGTATGSAKLTVKGSGTTSATTSLLVQNSSNRTSFTVADDGRVGINVSPYDTYALAVDPIAGASNVFVAQRAVANNTNEYRFVNSSGTPSAGSTAGSITWHTLSYLEGIYTSAVVDGYRTIDLRILGWSGSAAETARFTYDNKVGIGTTTPAAKVHISGSSNSALLEIDSPAVNNILYVSGSGNVGIGTSTPASSLHISGASAVLTLSPQDPLPSGVPTGSFAVSSSAPPKPYFYDGTTWNALY